MSEVVAREAKVTMGAGDFHRVCPACGGDVEVGHLVGNVRRELQMAILPDGRRVQVQVPVDEAYHFSCHADLGCDNCIDMLAHNKGKMEPGKIKTPDHLHDIEPHEYAMGDQGQLYRLRSKEEAQAIREAEHREAGVPYVSPEEARQIHAAHSRELAAKAGKS